MCRTLVNASILTALVLIFHQLKFVFEVPYFSYFFFEGFRKGFSHARRNKTHITFTLLLFMMWKTLNGLTCIVLIVILVSGKGGRYGEHGEEQIKYVGVRGRGEWE